jgi:hypothetical protein
MPFREFPAPIFLQKTPRVLQAETASRYVLICFLVGTCRTATVVYWSEFLAAYPEVLASIPGMPYFLRSTRSGTGSTQPREDK